MFLKRCLGSWVLHTNHSSNGPLTMRTRRRGAITSTIGSRWISWTTSNLENIINCCLSRTGLSLSRLLAAGLRFRFSSIMWRRAKLPTQKLAALLASRKRQGTILNLFVSECTHWREIGSKEKRRWLCSFQSTWGIAYSKTTSRNSEPTWALAWKCSWLDPRVPTCP